MGSSLLSEIREFLAGLRRELPGVFAKPPEREPLPRGAVFEDRAAHWSRTMGVRHGRIRVKDHRSLWGSCTAKGELNFNWRLLLAPPEVLDYVVVHELSHLVVKGHSRRFWDEVSRWCPDHRERRRWLRVNGPSLLRRRRLPADLAHHEGVVDQAAPR